VESRQHSYILVLPNPTTLQLQAIVTLWVTGQMSCVDTSTICMPTAGHVTKTVFASEPARTGYHSFVAKCHCFCLTWFCDCPIMCSCARLFTSRSPQAVTSMVPGWYSTNVRGRTHDRPTWQPQFHQLGNLTVGGRLQFIVHSEGMRHWEGMDM